MPQPSPVSVSEPAFSGAADRNKQPILDVLRQVLPGQGRALEIASGTGQHVAWFAAGLPQWTWQPTDARAEELGNISAWVARQSVSNVSAPVVLDVMATPWLPNDRDGHPPLFDAIYCANMLHISPWATCSALMQGSARHLTPDGALITYGPYLEDDVRTADGNLAFDQSLQARNPAWGLRRREDVAQAAAQMGLQLAARYALPANNLLLVWKRTR